MKKLVELALQEYGKKEIVGEEHNPDIVQYAKEAGFEWVNDDETPWCSIFMNWLAMKAKYIRSNKANARSWLNVGKKVKEPKLGDIIVLQRGNSNWKGHVGLFIRYKDSKSVYILGGNQTNMVNISIYNRNKILGFRRLHRVSKLKKLQSIKFNFKNL
ncbi:MAG: TIGR02594 family protein [bacterium]